MKKLVVLVLFVVLTISGCAGQAQMSVPSGAVGFTQDEGSSDKGAGIMLVPSGSSFGGGVSGIPEMSAVQLTEDDLAELVSCPPGSVGTSFMAEDGTFFYCDVKQPEVMWQGMLATMTAEEGIELLAAKSLINPVVLSVGLMGATYVQIQLDGGELQVKSPTKVTPAEITVTAQDYVGDVGEMHRVKDPAAELGLTQEGLRSNTHVSSRHDERLVDCLSAFIAKTAKTLPPDEIYTSNGMSRGNLTFKPGTTFLWNANRLYKDWKNLASEGQPCKDLVASVNRDNGVSFSENQLGRVWIALGLEANLDRGTFHVASFFAIPEIARNTRFIYLWSRGNRCRIYPEPPVSLDVLMVAPGGTICR